GCSYPCHLICTQELPFSDVALKLVHFSFVLESIYRIDNIGIAMNAVHIIEGKDVMILGGEGDFELLVHRVGPRYSASSHCKVLVSKIFQVLVLPQLHWCSTMTDMALSRQTMVRHFSSRVSTFSFESLMGSYPLWGL